jgi:transposase-like protein
MGEYTQDFKETMVKKLSGAEGKSAGELAREVGVPQSTLSRWLRDYGSLRGRGTEGTVGKQAQNWSAEEKLRAVVEYERLEQEARGKYLREKGLYDVDIQRWRTEMLGVLGKKARKGDAQGQRIRALEAELRRKESALAETAALLVLKKKAQAIWGDREDGK